jgi:hypothetical protein
MSSISTGRAVDQMEGFLESVDQVPKNAKEVGPSLSQPPVFNYGAEAGT